jgi:hypothetical protein
MFMDNFPRSAVFDEDDGGTCFLFDSAGLCLEAVVENEGGDPDVTEATYSRAAELAMGNLRDEPERIREQIEQVKIEIEKAERQYDLNKAAELKYGKLPDLEKKLAVEYRPLIQVVQSNVPADYHLMIAHECRYHGRKFVHLSLKNDSHLLSLVIARKSDGESFGIEGLLPELVSSGIPIYRAGVQRFEMAAIESRDYLVYFISDLPGQRNTEMMTAMAPQVNEFLRKIEAI